MNNNTFIFVSPFNEKTHCQNFSMENFIMSFIIHIKPFFIHFAVDFTLRFIDSFKVCACVLKKSAPICMEPRSHLAVSICSTGTFDTACRKEGRKITPFVTQIMKRRRLDSFFEIKCFVGLLEKKLNKASVIIVFRTGIVKKMENSGFE